DPLDTPQTRGVGSETVHVEPAGDPPEAPGKEVVLPPLSAEAAPPASPRLADVPQAAKLTGAIKTHFAGRPGKRIYVQVDKPLYKRGETVWIKTWDLRASDLEAAGKQGAIRYELISPKGAAVIQKRVQEDRGTATNDFEIPESVQGGEYLVRATAGD